jgi:hypothetical protein
MSEPDGGQSGARSSGQPEGVDLGKGGSAEDQPFDPYRFGQPDHPIPAEYAPPGYTGPTIPSGPSTPASPYGAPGAYPGTPGNPFGNPPGTPYSPAPPPQYPGPGPYGYGAPPPPPYHGYPQPRTNNGKAVAALVFGILSIVLCWLSFFDGIFVILGLIFGFIALGETKQGRARGRGLAIAGLVCTLVGAVLATLLTVLIVRAANDCGGFSNDNSEQWQTCVRDHFLD